MNKIKKSDSNLLLITRTVFITFLTPVFSILTLGVIYVLSNYLIRVLRIEPVVCGGKRYSSGMYQLHPGPICSVFDRLLEVNSWLIFIALFLLFVFWFWLLRKILRAIIK